jgi:hypothetical protein
VPFHKSRYVMERPSQRDPDEIVFFLHGIHRGLGPCRRWLIRMSGNTHAFPELLYSQPW